MKRRQLLVWAAAARDGVFAASAVAQTITLHGAVQFQRRPCLQQVAS